MVFWICLNLSEYKIMLSHYLLNGDCVRHDHLCQSTNYTQHPDCTACRSVCQGFSEPQNLTKAIVNLVTKASAKEIPTDNLFVLANSISLAESLKNSKDRCCDFVRTLQKFVGQIEKSRKY